MTMNLTDKFNWILIEILMTIINIFKTLWYTWVKSFWIQNYLLQNYLSIFCSREARNSSQFKPCYALHSAFVILNANESTGNGQKNRSEVDIFKKILSKPTSNKYFTPKHLKHTWILNVSCYKSEPFIKFKYNWLLKKLMIAWTAESLLYDLKNCYLAVREILWSICVPIHYLYFRVDKKQKWSAFMRFVAFNINSMLIRSQNHKRFTSLFFYRSLFYGCRTQNLLKERTKHNNKTKNHYGTLGWPKLLTCDIDLWKLHKYNRTEQCGEKWNGLNDRDLKKNYLLCMNYHHNHHHSHQ